MVQLTPQQEKRLGKIVKVIEDGNLAIASYIFELEDKFQELKDSIPNLSNVLEQVKGKDAKPDEVALQLKNDPDFVQTITPKDGNDGKDYILTEQDKKDIARSIKVPIVDRVIERTDIIHETPILKTEIVKETIKEIIKNDDMARAEIETLKTELGTVKTEMASIPRGTIGGSRPLKIMSSSTQVGGAVNEINFTGATVTSSVKSGRLVNVAISGGAGFTALTATGTIDDSNVTFTFVSTPTYVVINGIWRKSGEGWSGTTTVTLTAPVGVGGSIWAVS